MTIKRMQRLYKTTLFQAETQFLVLINTVRNELAGKLLVGSTLLQAFALLILREKGDIFSKNNCWCLKYIILEETLSKSVGERGLNIEFLAKHPCPPPQPQ